MTMETARVRRYERTNVINPPSRLFSLVADGRADPVSSSSWLSWSFSDNRDSERRLAAHPNYPTCSSGVSIAVEPDRGYLVLSGLFAWNPQVRANRTAPRA